jgi:hypothetical protein
MTFYTLLSNNASEDLVDYVLHVTMVEGTPVFELRPQGAAGDGSTYWSVAGDTLTSATDPD